VLPRVARSSLTLGYYPKPASGFSIWCDEVARDRTEGNESNEEMIYD